MTTGIYSLYWEDQDLIYIGQSVDIETRFRVHTNEMLKNKHSNYKVQDAFNKYGLPTFNILEKCSSRDLDNLEIVWQNEFNSLDSLDLIDAGLGGGRGTHNSNSKYSEKQLIELYFTLANDTLSIKDISIKLNIHKSIIGDIVRGTKHIWLQEQFPEYFSIITNKFIPRNKTNNFLFKDPKGNLLEINNLNKFCRDNNLDQANMSKVHAGKSKQHLGYTKYIVDRAG